MEKSVHGVSFIDKVGILNSIPPSAPPGAIREFQLFKGFDQQIGCGPSSCNTLRAVEKAQVTKGLNIAVQARGVGGLHASLLSGTDDKPAAPVFAPRFLLALQLLMHPLLLNGPMQVISTIQSPTVRERREKMMVGPMFAGYKCASAAWAACEKVRVGLCGVGKERLWDRFKVKVLI